MWPARLPAYSLMAIRTHALSVPQARGASSGKEPTVSPWDCGPGDAVSECSWTGVVQDGRLWAVVVEAADADAAASISAADPYAKVGLFESVEIRPWTWTFNNPANG